jgi:hypothetical protein
MLAGEEIIHENVVGDLGRATYAAGQRCARDL